MITDVTIKYTDLKCIDEGEAGAAEPYLWVAFFKIDGFNVRVRIDMNSDVNKVWFEKAEDTARWVDVIPLGGGYSVEGNIGGAMENGATRSLDFAKADGYRPFVYALDSLWPMKLGFSWTQAYMDLTDLGSAVPGYVGTLAVLWEADGTPPETMAKAYDAFMSTLASQLTDFVRGFELNAADVIGAVWSGQPVDVNIPKSAIDKIKKATADSVRKVIETDTLGFVNVITHPIGLDADDVLGKGFWIWNSADLQDGTSHDFEKSMEPDGDGKWRLRGRISSAGRACFIASAAIGSAAPEVLVLRAFRDQSLARSRLGRWLIAKYYALSPDIALAVAESPWLRRIVGLGVRTTARVIGLLGLAR